MTSKQSTFNGAQQTQETSALWQRLTQYNIDTAEAKLNFAQRLARENNWTQAFAEQALVEYKRFMFLIVHTGRPQTPSDQVDQVWHLHLTYSQSYWQEFCPKILGQNIHHGPTKGGQQQRILFRAQYAQTLHDYEQSFGKAPAEFWPSVDDRFKNATEFVRVNTKETWLIKKPLWLISMKSKHWASIGLTGVLSSAAFNAFTNDEVSSSGGFSSLIAAAGVAIIVVLLLFVVALQKNQKTKSANKPADSSGGSSGSNTVNTSAPAGSSKNANSKDSADGTDSGGSGCGSACGGGCGG
jgi:hypothetical protein